MKIKNALLAGSAVKKAQYPEEQLPQIALLGRSNAGKSSLINTLINRKNLARTSSAPGKTRLLNFYRVDAVSDEGENAYRWYYVDLPGYGYAKAAKSDRDTWLRFIDEYLQSPSPRQCWQLVDIRHAPSKEDISMHQILRDAGFDLQVIANKADKISRGAWAKSLKEISKALEIKSSEIIVFSAMSKEGKDTLLKKTEDFLLSWEDFGEEEAE